MSYIKPAARENRYASSISFALIIHFSLIESNVVMVWPAREPSILVAIVIGRVLKFEICFFIESVFEPLYAKQVPFLEPFIQVSEDPVIEFMIFKQLFCFT